jgi:hypothetical protein
LEHVEKKKNKRVIFISYSRQWYNSFSLSLCVKERERKKMQIVHKSSDIFCFKIRKKKERKKDARELLAPVTRRGCHANQRHLSLRCWSSGGMEKNEQSVMRAAREQEKNKIDGTMFVVV